MKYNCFLFAFRYNIEVVGISSDGDPRLLSSMISQSEIFNEDFSKGNVDSSKIAFVQDTIHFATKSRNRLLASAIILVMGKKQVSAGHLKILIRYFSKEEHGLIMTDICPEDRQNYESMRKIMEPQVLKMLAENVPDSEATIMYLKICNEITSSFLDCTINPTERIYRIWHGLYFLRIWRNWILESAEYTLKDNFITSNAYICGEINAYFLIHLIVKFRDENRKEQFLPIFFSSQTCESTFRQMRSLSTVNWTKVNFSLLELFHSIGRIELLTDIMYHKLENTDIVFPRIKDKASKVTIFDLPTNEEIQNILVKSKNDAINDARFLGMELDNDNTIPCKIKLRKITKSADDLIMEYDLDDEMDQDLQEAFEDLTTGAQNHVSMNKPSFCLDVVDKNGNIKKVRKSSIVSLLSTTKNGLSNDRLRRVQDHPDQKFRRRLEFNSEDPRAAIFEASVIRVGDWCSFRTNKKIRPNAGVRANLFTGCVIIGMVLGFRHNAKARWQKTYKWDHITLSSENQHNIEVLASWHTFNKDGTLSMLKDNSHFYISSQNYLASLQNPALHVETNHTENKIIFKNFDLITENLELLYKKKKVSA